jgi:ketosteroid isomerase-like protein
MDNRDDHNRDDQGAIRNLLARLVYEGDSGEVAAYMALLTEDVVWAMPGVEHRGAEEVRRGMIERRGGGLTGPGSSKRHVLTTTEVSVHGDTAQARSTWLLVGGGGAAPALLRYGLYEDRFHRAADGWRLGARRITFDGA